MPFETSLRCLAATLLCLSVASASLASGPATHAQHDPTEAAMESSFRGFAKSWMDKALARAARNQVRPRALGRSEGLTFLYRAVADDYDVALEPTGNPRSPYVGVLRYTEQTFQCRDARGAECTLASSQPVSEVFRFRGGRWSY
jgi:hypothetical protein